MMVREVTILFVKCFCEFYKRSFVVVDLKVSMFYLCLFKTIHTLSLYRHEIDEYCLCNEPSIYFVST